MQCEECDKEGRLAGVQDQIPLLPTIRPDECGTVVRSVVDLNVVKGTATERERKSGPSELFTAEIVHVDYVLWSPEE